MLDGLQNDQKPYKAVAFREYEDGKTVKLTLHFTALNEGEAQRFLVENGYGEYKLTNEESTAR